MFVDGERSTIVCGFYDLFDFVKIYLPALDSNSDRPITKQFADVIWFM